MSIRAGVYEAAYNTQYLYDERGLIMGVVKKDDGGWAYRSCCRRHSDKAAWSDELGPVATQEQAIEQCTVHYITRILE